MAYIGNQPTEAFTSFATQEFSTSATSSYTLDHAVTNENEIALFINNVRQQPGSGKAYTAAGTALTLSANTASTDTMYCVFLGRALQTVNPATNSITTAMISDDAVTAAKIADAVSFGKVLQVVQTTKTDTFSTTNTYSGGFADITGLSVAITPSATSSKVLVLVQIYNSVDSNTQFFNLIRGSTNLLQPGSGSLKATIANDGNMGNVSITFLDSPSSTSETTYKVATAREASGTVYVNRRQDSDNHTGSSTITAIEIGA